MKKIISALMMIILVLCLVGCTNKNPNIKKSQNDARIEFWTDKETGVQYVIYDHDSGYAGMGGITPRLNSDGTLYHPIEKGGVSDA